MARKTPHLTPLHAYEAAGLSRRRAGNRIGVPVERLLLVETGRARLKKRERSRFVALLGEPRSWETVVPESLRSRRMALGLSGREIGEATGFSKTHVLSWESGEQLPGSVVVLERLAGILQCSVEDLGRRAAIRAL